MRDWVVERLIAAEYKRRKKCVLLVNLIWKKPTEATTTDSLCYRNRHSMFFLITCQPKK